MCHFCRFNCVNYSASTVSRALPHLAFGHQTLHCAVSACRSSCLNIALSRIGPRTSWCIVCWCTGVHLKHGAFWYIWPSDCLSFQFESLLILWYVDSLGFASLFGCCVHSQPYRPGSMLDFGSLSAPRHLVWSSLTYVFCLSSSLSPQFLQIIAPSSRSATYNLLHRLRHRRRILVYSCPADTCLVSVWLISDTVGRGFLGLLSQTCRILVVPTLFGQLVRFSCIISGNCLTWILWA